MSDSRRNTHDLKAKCLEEKQSWGSKSDLLNLRPDATENNCARDYPGSEPRNVSVLQTEEN